MNLRAFSSSTIFFFSRLEELRLLQKLFLLWFQVFLSFVFGKTTLLKYLHESPNHLNLLGVFVLWRWVVIVQKHGSLSAPRNSILDRLLCSFFLLLSRQPIFFFLLLDLLGTWLNALTQQTLYGRFQLKSWIMAITYSFLLFFALSIVYFSLLFFLFMRFNFLSASVLTQSHSSGAARLLNWFVRRCRSGWFLLASTELLNLRRSFINVVSFKGFWLGLWKVGWSGFCDSHLRFFSGKLLFELTLHGLEHFSGFNLTNFRFKCILFAKMLRRKLSLSILVFLHTTRHACFSITHFCLFVNPFFTRLFRLN